MVDKVWKDTADEVAISRGQMAHHQVISATLEMDGDNAYLKNRGGLDFGIRMAFIANEENTGVDRIVEPLSELSADEQIERHREEIGTKYKIPEITNIEGENLPPRVKEFLKKNLQKNRMTREIKEF